MPRRKSREKKRKTKLSDGLIDFFLYGTAAPDQEYALELYFMNPEEGKRLWDENRKEILRRASKKGIKKIWAIKEYEKKRRQNV